MQGEGCRGCGVGEMCKVRDAGGVVQGEGCRECGVGEMCKGRDAGGVVWVRCARGGMQGVWCG